MTGVSNLYSAAARMDNSPIPSLQLPGRLLVRDVVFIQKDVDVESRVGEQAIRLVALLLSEILRGQNTRPRDCGGLGACQCGQLNLDGRGVEEIFCASSVFVLRPIGRPAFRAAAEGEAMPVQSRRGSGEGDQGEEG